MIKVFSKKYPTIQFSQTSVNYCKDKIKSRADDGGYKKAGRPNILDDTLLVKVKDIALVLVCLVVSSIDNSLTINIKNGMIRANNLEILKEFSGTIELTECWARIILKNLNWSKRRAANGKIEPPLQLFAEEKFTFQKAIAKAIQDNDNPLDLVIDLDQTPSCYVSPGKYTFHFKEKNHVPIKGVYDKRQITTKFGMSAVGEFLPMQVIYGGKMKQSLPKFNFAKSFSLSFKDNHWSNTSKSKKIFMNNVFLCLETVKEQKCILKVQYTLVLMDTFKSHDNDILKELCHKNL